MSAPVDNREELIYLLSRAAELEHSLACIYLYAAHSLKSDPSEGGLTEEQAALGRGWKRRLAGVAIEEMLHLAQVANLLTAIGGAPHLRRSNFPIPSSAFSFGIRMSLEPFSLPTIERLVCYEMPEHGVLSPDREAAYESLRRRIAPHHNAPAPPQQLSCEPHDVDYRTVGEFYHKISSGFATIPETTLFIGPPAAQAKGRFLDFDGQLIPIAGRASAQRAIEMIVEQGEAPTADHPDAHFCVFDEIRIAFQRAVHTAKSLGTPFEPVRPVVSNPTTRFFANAAYGTPITDATTCAASDVFNIAYDTLLLVLLRFFAHGDETEAELGALSHAALQLMTGVLRPLGEALTKMPAGPEQAGKTAGPGFGYNRDVHLLPHKPSAWIFFAERMRGLAGGAGKLAAHRSLPPEIAEAAATLESLAANFSSGASS